MPDVPGIAFAIARHVLGRRNPAPAALWLVVVAACTESPEDRLNSLLDDNDVVCGRFHEPAYPPGSCIPPDVPPAQAAECMTNALADGTRARISWSNTDAHLFSFVTYAFTVDHEVKLFDYYPGPSNTGYEPHVSREATCDGPFYVAQFVCPFNGASGETVRLDGCSP